MAETSTVCFFPETPSFFPSNNFDAERSSNVRITEDRHFDLYLMANPGRSSVRFALVQKCAIVRTTT